MPPGNKEAETTPALEYTWKDLRNVLPEDLIADISSNHAPSKAALQYAKSIRAYPGPLLKTVKQRLFKLDEEIAQLMAEKAVLTDTPRVEATLVKICDSISSPIRRLPFDVLREIFLHAVNSTPYPGPVPKTAPFVLTHVCSTWRSIATSSPRLWTTLYLRVKKISHYGIKQRHEAARTWLQRAGSFPLELFLYFDCDRDAMASELSTYTVKLFLSALAPWTPQIYRLGIGAQYWTGLMLHFAGIDWDLSSLKRLDILGQKPTDVSFLADEMAVLGLVQDRITIFRNSSLLSCIAATQEMTCFLEDLTFIPWEQITHLSLDEMQCETPHYADLARFCPRLNNARLFVDTRYNQAPSTLPLVCHENLVNLELSMATPDYRGLVDFFKRNDFPRLSFLHFNIADAQEEYPSETGGRYGKFRQLPSLRKLIITGEPLPTSLVCDLLLKCPLLETLDISIGHMRGKPPMTDVNELCQRMTIRNGQCELVPLLRECLFRYVDNSEFTVHHRECVFTLNSNAVNNFVRSRTQGVPPNFSCLKSIDFTGGFQFLEDVQMLGNNDTHRRPFRSQINLQPFEHMHHMPWSSFADSVRHWDLIDD